MRNRVTISGPESDLIDSFLRNGSTFGRGNDVVLFREPNLPTGYPDLVFVYPNALGKRPAQQQRFELSSDHIRVLHHIYFSRDDSLDAISVSLNSGVRKTRQILDDLVAAGFAHWLGDTIGIVPIEDVFIAKQIIAVEAKVRDWKGAIQQAVANTWFASQSYILLPRLTIIDRVCEEAARFGVGVIICDDVKAEVILCPERIQMPSSYGSWIINEWAAKELSAGVMIV